MSCTIPANEPIYQALHAKAKSYPSSEVFRRQAYQNAAMRLLTHDVDLFSIEIRTYELADHLDQYWGPKTATFIENFIKENPPTARPRMTCTVPANEPIYKALLAKANSYPADKPYQAKAYKKAAETVMSYEKNIYDEYSRYNVFYDYPGNIGPRIEEFIRKFIKENPPIATPDGWEDEEMKRPDCFTPSNNGLYVALLKRAREREASGNKYSAKYYRDAAAKVLAATRPIPSSPSWDSYSDEELDTLGGPGVVAFIKLYLEESLYPPVLKPTEDDIIKRTIKVYCYKNNLTYLDVLVDEYKAWRPTAPSWALENYDYKTDKTSPKTTEEVVKYWAWGASKTLQDEQKENSYNKCLKNYCKKNNIVYQPLMLDRLNAWRNDPANKKKLVVTYHSCGWGGAPWPTPREYPLGTVAVINKWFQTLPKTVSL